MSQPSKVDKWLLGVAVVCAIATIIQGINYHNNSQRDKKIIQKFQKVTMHCARCSELMEE